VTALVEVLALRFFDTQDLHVGALRQVFKNLQAGRAFLSVDKYFRAHLDLTGLLEYGGASARRNAILKPYGGERAQASVKKDVAPRK
jgi:hypothetical protein